MKQLIFVIVSVILFNFVHCTRTYTSHQNLVKCTGSQEIQYPASIPEVVSLVKTAIASRIQVKIKAVGTLHSITNIICTDGLPISMTKINHAIYNPRDESATFGAGIRLNDALTFLEEKGRTLIHVPAWGLITLGGAIASGAHGSSLLHPTTLSDQVLRLTVVDGRGSLGTVQDFEEDFAAFKGHLGLLGIIVEVTLRTVPLFKMRLAHTLYSDSVLFSGEAVTWAKELDAPQFFWFPLLGQVVLANGTYLNGNVPGSAKLNPISVGRVAGYSLMTANSILYSLGVHALFKLAHNALKSHIVQLIESDGLVVNPGIGPGWRLLCYECQPGSCIWEYEPFQDTSLTFDLEDFPKVLALVQSTAINFPEIFHTGMIFIRFLAASSALTSTTGGKDGFVVEWLTSDRVITGRSDWAKEKVAKYDDMMRQMVDKFEGRPHWGKKGLCYFRARNFPKLKQFRASVRKWDPNEVFQNEFSTGILNFLEDEEVQTVQRVLGPFCTFDENNSKMCRKEPKEEEL